MTLLGDNGIEFPEAIRAAAALTDYSVEARYPGPFEPVNEDEFKEAASIAEIVIRWAETQVIHDR